MCASPISGSLAETPTTTPTKRRNSVTTPKKSLLVKGSTIYLKDAEAKVAAVEGNFIRVHYKVRFAANTHVKRVNLAPVLILIAALCAYLTCRANRWTTTSGSRSTRRTCAGASWPSRRRPS